MKSKNEMVPEFDDIIFRNRNKQYGAYNLRKKYKSAASFSVLGGVAICTILITVFSFSSGPGTASTGQTVVTVVMSDPGITNVAPPVVKAPPAISNVVNNLKPEVTEDTSEVTRNIPITDALISTSQNKPVNDTLIVPADNEPIEIPAEKKIWIKVEEMPEFPGGEQALFRFIAENIHYPIDAQNNNIQGKVMLKFVITPDGSVSGIEILRSVDQALDNEAIRVVSSLPKFKPGKQNGIPVHVAFSLPVSFRIENN